MLNPTLTYQTANALATRTPCYTLEVLGRRYSTHHLFDYFEEVMADSPSLYLRLGETSGAAAIDESGNGLDGVYQDTPTLGVTGALSGDENLAVTLNGSSEYITVNDNPLLDPGDTFTLEIWATRPADVSASPVLIGKNTNGYLLYIHTDGTLKFGKYGGSTIANSSAAMSVLGYNHIVVAKSASSSTKIYLNGIDVTSFVGDQTIVATASALHIGSSHAPAAYLGSSVDEFALYPTALSAARVLAHYDAGRGLQHLAGVDRYIDIRGLRGVSAQVEPERGRSSVGSITIPLIDIDGEVTELLAENPNNQQAIFRAGFTDICYSDFTVIQRGVIEGMPLSPDMLAYNVTMRDPSALTNKKVFDGAASKLALAIGTGDTTLNLVSASDYQDSGYLRIEGELISYSGRSSTGRLPNSNGSWTSLAFGAEFVTVNSNASGTTLLSARSDDGLDWDTSVVLGGSLNAVAFAPTVGASGRYAAVGASACRTSDDGGRTWTTRTIPAGTYLGVVWAAGLGLFVAVGINVVATSPTGETWTARTPAEANTYRSVAWSESQGLLVKVSSTGTNRVGTSPDGITWTPVAAAEANSWWSVTYHAAGDNWVAVAATGTNRVMTSADAATWAPIAAAAANDWLAVLSLASGTLVAVAQSGANRVMRSTNDGASWSAIAASAAHLWSALAEGAGLLVAIGAPGSGTLAVVMTSDDDGLTWTSSGEILTGLTRGVDIPTGIATAAATHAADVTVKEVFRLGPGHIVDIIEDVLLNTDKTGCSVPAALVNSTVNAAVKTAIGASYTAEFLIEEAVNAKQWIETEGCAPFGLYPGIGEKWQLVRIAADATPADTIVDADIVTDGGRQRIQWDPSYSSIINRVTIQYDWNPITQQYETSTPFESSASITANGPRPLVVSSKGLRTSLAGTSDLVAAIASRILARWENGAPRTNLTVFLQKNLLEPGDIIELTAVNIPDTDTGLRGVTDQLNEVTSRSLNFADGVVDMELLCVG